MRRTSPASRTISRRVLPISYCTISSASERRVDVPAPLPSAKAAGMLFSTPTLPASFVPVWSSDFVSVDRTTCWSGSYVCSTMTSRCVVNSTFTWTRAFPAPTRAVRMFWISCDRRSSMPALADWTPPWLLPSGPSARIVSPLADRTVTREISRSATAEATRLLTATACLRVTARPDSGRRMIEARGAGASREKGSRSGNTR